MALRRRAIKIQKMVKGMSLDEAQRVYDKASDKEKAQLEPMLRKKEYSHEKEYVAQ
jgi:hypothetical protein